MKRIVRLLTGVLLAILNNYNFVNAQPPRATTDTIERKWWKEAIIYQIYPRSFYDSNGDGIGDLPGIITRLDYIKSLGVNVVWLNPIYTSPNEDNGYDISDYRAIMTDFGTMADFDRLVKEMHHRKIRLVMDVVVNHSSDEHDWFKQSRSAKDNPYRNYYHWWNAEKGKPPYRYSLFDVNHDAWRYDSLTNAYYLHYFSAKQPDLNWENPQLRQEVYSIMKFWADKGVDGFRMDAFNYVAKDTTFPTFPLHYERAFNFYYSMQGNLHGYLQEMYREVFSQYDVMSVAEGAGNSETDAHNLVDADRNELNMAYAFDALGLAKPGGIELIRFKRVFTNWDSAFANRGWLSIFLSNHDQARLVNRFGNESPRFREPSAKMLATFLMTMRGTPYWYNGDELGMTNAGFRDIEQYRDLQARNEYEHLKNTGGNLTSFLKELSFSGRDNGRTPFQWNDSLNAGFTTGTPWLPVTKNYPFINQAAEAKNPSSVLNYFRQVVQLRKEHLVLVYGKYTLLDKNNPAVYAYTRGLNSKKMLILLNFTAKRASVKLGISLRKATLLLDNYPLPAQPNVLRPYEAAIYLL